MTKVHPNASPAVPPSSESESPCVSGGKPAEAVVYTVWRKSLLFNGNGFTVFDAKGNLVFRVENYSAGSRNEIVLMDAAGKPLLTLRRKVLKKKKKKKGVSFLGAMDFHSVGQFRFFITIGFCFGDHTG